MRSAIGRWALGVGRWTFAATAALLLLASCGPDDNLKKSSIRYSPPAVYPVRQNISDAQTHAKAEASAASNAAKAIAKAQTVAPANVPDLQEALAEASGQVNQVVSENGLLQKALAAAQKHVDELETKVGEQTVKLNTANDDKNTAIDRADRIAKESAITEKKYHRLKAAICGLLAAAVAWLIWKLGLFRLVSSFSILGPWGFGAAIAVAIGIPGIVFAFLWAIL